MTSIRFSWLFGATLLRMRRESRRRSRRLDHSRSNRKFSKMISRPANKPLQTDSRAIDGGGVVLGDGMNRDGGWQGGRARSATDKACRCQRKGARHGAVPLRQHGGRVAAVDHGGRAVGDPRMLVHRVVVRDERGAPRLGVGEVGEAVGRAGAIRGRLEERLDLRVVVADAWPRERAHEAEVFGGRAAMGGARPTPSAVLRVGTPRVSPWSRRAAVTRARHSGRAVPPSPAALKVFLDLNHQRGARELLPQAGVLAR